MVSTNSLIQLREPVCLAMTARVELLVRALSDDLVMLQSLTRAFCHWRDLAAEGLLGDPPPPPEPTTGAAVDAGATMGSRPELVIHNILLLRMYNICFSC